MAEHSPIAPSSAGVFVHCAGSVLMQAMFPEREGEREAAREGTAVHEVAMPLLHAAARGGVGPEQFEKGRQASNGVVITTAMVQAATLYAVHVGQIMREYGVFVSYIEVAVACLRIHTQSWGTPDCWLFDQATGTLCIWDLKYGFEIVEVFENWQLINYVAGILDLLDVDDQFVTVRFFVVQPRAPHRDGPIREWRVKASDLRAQINVLSAAAHEALSDSPRTTAGAWCRHCSARHACETSQRAGLAIMDFSGQSNPVNATPGELGLELQLIERALEILKARQTGLAAEIEALIRNGSIIPGWTMRPTYGREEWERPLAEVFALGQIYGVDLHRKETAITPRQAVAAGVPDDIVRSYTHKPRRGLTLVEDDGTRAQHIFGQAPAIER
jgi:hypothetical protein